MNAAGIGIQALIDNDDLELLNEAQFGFVNDGADVGGDVTQTAKLEQRNSVTSKITVWNSGDVTAADIGVSAEIETAPWCRVMGSGEARRATRTSRARRLRR